MMKIKIFAKNIELTEDLKKYVNKKVESFDKHLGKNNQGERVCDFRLGKDTNAHQKGKIFFAEAKIETPEKNYGARAEAESIEAAIDELKDEILTKIRRNKDKKETLLKKGAREVKKILTGKKK